MWSLEDCKILFMVVCVVGILLISTPMLLLLVPQTSEQFSELYIFSANHVTENYPHNIKAGVTNNIYLDIANYMGVSSYYLLTVKLRDRNESLPNASMNIPSSLPAIVEYRVFVADDKIWEKPFNFSIPNLSLQGNYCLVKTLSINGLTYNVEKQIAWDSEFNGYFVELLFELWRFDTNTQVFSFNNRWVGIWLNMTGIK